MRHCFTYNPNPEIPVVTIDQLMSFQRIPNFYRESMHMAETEYHKRCQIYPFAILIDRQPEVMDCFLEILNLVRDQSNLQLDCFYMMPAVELTCEERPGYYDLYYWPLSCMLYAVDLTDQSYVYGLYMRVPPQET